MNEDISMSWKSLILAVLILLGSIISVEFGLLSAIVEIILGASASAFFDLSDIKWLEFLAGLGLMTIMFMAGFETDIILLKRNLKKVIIIGFSSYLITFLGVVLTSYYFLDFSMKTAILLGIALSTTSLAIVYPFLRERGYLKSEFGQIAVGAAMIVDLLSMISLTIFFTGFNFFVLLIAVFLIASFWIVPLIGKYLFGRYVKNKIEFEVKFILFVLLALGIIGQFASIHSAVVAFVFGVMLAELIKQHELLEDKLKGITYGFLAPIFFFYAGTLLDIKTFSWDLAKLVMVFLILGFGLKYLATFFSSRIFLPKQAKFLAGLFNFRLSFAIIAATFGLTTGLINAELFSAIIVVVLLSSIIPSVICRKRILTD